MKPPIYILRSLAFLFLTQAVLAQQPTPILPDLKLTPGDTFDVTAQDVCVSGYAKKVRSVPAWLKRQAYAEYGITEYKTGDYEVDHLIPLSLGGSNSIRNLWPQSTKTSPWNSYVKDALERKLHNLVCAGQLDLKTAQHEIPPTGSKPTRNTSLRALPLLQFAADLRVPTRELAGRIFWKL
jgi:hypothetical protein